MKMIMITLRLGPMLCRPSALVDYGEIGADEEISFDIAYRTARYYGLVINGKERRNGKRQAFCSFNPQRSRMKYYSYVKGYVTVVEIGLGEPESIESSLFSRYILPSSFFAVEDRQTDRQTRSSLVSATKCLSFTFNEKVQNSSVRRQSSTIGGRQIDRRIR
jgi:hypothetical protein